VSPLFTRGHPILTPLPIFVHFNRQYIYVASIHRPPPVPSLLQTEVAVVNKLIFKMVLPNCLGLLFMTLLGGSVTVASQSGSGMYGVDDAVALGRYLIIMSLDKDVFG